MLKKLSTILFFLLFSVSAVFAQSGSITGQVTDAETGETLPGVNVVLAETDQGTATDVNGEYALTGIPAGNYTLRATFVGFSTYEATVEVEDAEVVHDIEMEVDVLGLDDVVVTAFGVQREQRSLGYSSQNVDAADLVRNRETNFVNSLQGKISGAQVVNSGSSLGSSTRIVLRGVSSLSGDNQPLFVVDGVYIDNSNFDPAGEFGYGPDYGNAAMDINPDDIESISVLKGPNAAALYGSRAANGAIIITTKDGRGPESEGIGVTVNSTVTAEDILVLPDLQNEYGQGTDGEFSFVDGRGGGVNDGVDESWGPPLDGREIPQFWSNGEPEPWVPAPDNVRDYFNTGLSLTNNVSMTGNYEQANFRLSYTNVQQDGLFPAERLVRNNVSLTAGTQLSDRFRAEGRVSYTQLEGRNRPSVGYTDDNPMQQLTQWFGRQIDTNRLRDYKDEEGQPINWNYNYFDNPFWTQYENGNQQGRDRVIGNVSLIYDFNDWLSIEGLTGTDFYQEDRTDWRAVHTINDPDGYFSQNVRDVHEWTANARLSADRELSSDIHLDASLGSEVQRRIYNMRYSEAPGLSVPYVYTVTNSSIPPETDDYRSEKQINSLFGSATLGYRDYLFLDLTGRNDWSSTLPSENNSYFYPSASLSFVFTDAFAMPGWMSEGKLRAGWTQVGDDTDPYQLVATYESTSRFGDMPTYTVSNRIPNAELRPERTESFELGSELRLLDSRLGLDVAFYSGRTIDQILPVQVSRASGYDEQMVNAGEIKNEGIEVSLDAIPVATSDFIWDFTVNWSTNRNEVVSLAEDLDSYLIGDSWDLTVEARPGEEFGTLYGLGFARDDDGNILTDGGMPVIGDEQKAFGSYQPDWEGSFQNTLSYKGFELSALVDARKGGVLSSVTYMFGRYTGILQETVEGREDGLIFDGDIWADGAVDIDTGEPNEERVSAQAFNKATFFGNAESHIFDASYVKLREVSLSYSLPQRLLGGLPIHDVDVGLVARNLWIIYKAAPHIDPETAFSNTNLQGLESNQFPSARSLGFNLRFSL